MDGLELRIIEKAKRKRDLLTSFELNFIRSLDKLGPKHNTSKLQRRKLMEIWRKISNDPKARSTVENRLARLSI